MAELWSVSCRTLEKWEEVRMMEERRQEREAPGLGSVSRDDVAAIQRADCIHKHIGTKSFSSEYSWSTSDVCRE